MRTTFFLSLIIAGVCAFWACNNSNSTGPITVNGSSAYYPLAIGNLWAYKYYTDSDGVINPYSGWNDVQIITDTERIGAYLAYDMEDLSDRGIGQPRNPYISTTAPISKLAVDLQGNLRVFTDTTSNTERGGVWNIVENFSNRMQGIPVSYNRYIRDNYPPYSVVVNSYLGRTSVSVPAGTFEAELYKDSSGVMDFGGTSPAYIADVRTSYYAPGIGLVKFVELTTDSVITVGTPGVFKTLGVYGELLSYSVK